MTQLVSTLLNRSPYPLNVVLEARSLGLTGLKSGCGRTQCGAQKLFGP